MKEIVIASSSPRRKKLASQMGLEFEIIPSSYEEDMTLDLTPEELAKTLALGKALDVYEKNKDKVVIGMDTFCVLGDKLLGKPIDEKDAKDMLRKMSGQKVLVYTGVAIIDSNGQEVDFTISKCKMAKINDSEIDNYIKTREPLDKAGAIATQGLGSVFIEKIDGCYHGMVGFPINKVYQMLKKKNIDVTKLWKS